MFLALFCERFRCSPAEYEEQAFNRLLYAHARAVAPIIRIVRPDFFSHDLKFIRMLGRASDLGEATDDLRDFKDVNDDRTKYWRNALRLRVSGRKAIRLAAQLFT
jgi:hypothetical protein